METEVRIQLQAGRHPESCVNQYQDAVNFVAQTIERVLQQHGTHTATFDPNTGEPYTPLTFNPQVVHAIGHVRVAASSSVVAILQQGFKTVEDPWITIEPICFNTAEMDDD